MRRLLIVDDREPNRALLRRLLGDEYAIVEASSSHAALALAPSCDLVLLDPTMPGPPDSIETLRRLKHSAGQLFIPVILITALQDQAIRVDGLRAGADDFLTKPVDPVELRLRVRNLLLLRQERASLAERNMQLLSLQRFKDEMSTLIVHDLKNPAGVVTTNLEFALATMRDPDPDVVEALRDSQMAMRRLLGLCSTFLDLSRLENGQLAPAARVLELAPLVGNVVEMRRAVARSHGTDLTVQIDPSARARADVELLTRMLENVLDNALRHTPPNGHIGVRQNVQDHRVQIRLGNTGDPIPPAQREAIFQKYRRGGDNSSVSRTNLGLGLYFCKMAADAQGGRIWVEQSPEYATDFVIELPEADA